VAARNFSYWGPDRYEKLVDAGDYRTIEERLERAEYKEQRGAVSALLSRPNERTLDIAFKLINSRDPGVRMAIAVNLGAMPENRRIQFKEALITTDPSLCNIICIAPATAKRLER
jgi:HEAT repeat protein